MEVPDPNNLGKVMYQHFSLQFKEIKQLKEAVAAYDAQPPFTLTLVESFSVLNLTLSNWQ